MDREVGRLNSLLLDLEGALAIMSPRDLAQKLHDKRHFIHNNVAMLEECVLNILKLLDIA